MKVAVDYSKCETLGICEGLAPQVFEVSDSGQLVILNDSPDDDILAEVEDAVTSCPMAALRIVSE